VEPGKTYLLRIINAGLFSEFYLKIAGHKFTVVAADANYVRPFTTDVTFRNVIKSKNVDFKKFCVSAVIIHLSRTSILPKFLVN